MLERDIGSSDLDVATADQADDFLLVVEAKAFVDDPVEQLEDLKVWTQLADNVDAMRDPSRFALTFVNENLKLGSVVGLAVVPARMTPVTEHTDDFGALGVEDLRDLAASSSSPRELWRRIKATETAGSFTLKREKLQVASWILHFDVGDQAAMPEVIRVPPGAGA